jgi:hypothetical protein
MTYDRQLHIGHLNVYHLANKVPDLCVLLSQPNPFHLFGVTESRLNSNISDEAVGIQDFTVLRRDAEYPGQTGIAVYFHNSISGIIRRRGDLESKAVECIWVELRADKSSPVLVGYIYRNPASTFQWFDDFTVMMDKVRQSTSEILILGDFNINMFLKNPAWECTTSMFGLKQLVNTATRVSQTSSTLIDHIYTTNKSRVVGVEVPQVGISDHYPVCCCWALKADNSFRKHQHTTIRYRSHKHFNKDAFLNDLNSAPFDTVYYYNNPNDALSEWYRLFLGVLDKHAPFREKRVKNPQLPAWLSKEIKEAMQLRDDFKRNKDFAGYRRQRNRVKHLVRKAQRSLFHRLMNGKKDVVSVWRAINAFTRSKNTAQCTQLSADTLNQHFLSTANTLLQSTYSGRPSAVSQKLKTFCTERLDPDTSFSIPLLTVYDVGKSISFLKNKRTSGHDGISSIVLKMALPYIVDTLTYIYNLCIKQGTFPSTLKTAKVIPLPKTKDLTDPNMFRPISLLSTLSKPIERHIHTHLQHFLEKHKLIHPLQSGFRRKHSCHTALVHLVDRWLTAMNNGLMTGAVFLDLSKAFDLVNHKTLIQKLTVYQLITDTLAFLTSYLERRTQHVYVNGKSSQEGVIEHGVPQGSILGPLLFSVFINDLPLHITDSSVTCSLFADDGTLDVSSSKVTSMVKSLQDSLNDVSEWCQNNSMIPNPTKTKCMLITTRQKHQLNPPPLQLTLNGQPVEQVKEQRVLGISLDEKLCWQGHITKLCKIVSKNVFLLSKLRYFTDEPTRKLFYYAHVQPHLDYASSIWDGSSEANLKSLNSLHRRAIKLIVDRPSEVLSTDNKFKMLDILPLEKQFMYNKLVLMRKITLSKTPAYLNSLFHFAHSRSSRTPGNNLVVPMPRLDIYKSSLSYSGAKLWNSIPADVRAAPSLRTFKTKLLKHLRKT